MPAITQGCELKVPRAMQTSAGRASSKRRISSRLPHTTPTGKPPATVLP